MFAGACQKVPKASLQAIFSKFSNSPVQSSGN